MIFSPSNVQSLIWRSFDADAKPIPLGRIVNARIASLCAPWMVLTTAPDLTSQIAMFLSAEAKKAA